MPVEFLKPTEVGGRRGGVEFLKPEPLPEDVRVEEPTPSVVEEPTFTEERLKTMELEGIPLRGPAEMEKQVALKMIGGEPLEGVAAVPVDVAETALHFAKGVAALPAVGSKMGWDVAISMAAGTPYQQAVEEALEKSAWITPKPVGGEFGDFVAGAFEKLHEGFLAVGEQVPEPRPMFDMSPEARSLVHDLAKTVVGTAAEGGFYLLMGMLGRGLYRRAKGRKITVEDVKETLSEVREAPPEGIEGVATTLADALERSFEKPTEPRTILRKREVPPIEPGEAVGEIMPKEVELPKVEVPSNKIEGVVRKSEEVISNVEVMPPPKETGFAKLLRQPEVVFIEVKDATGNLIGSVFDYYDGTVEGVKRVATQLERTARENYPDMSSIESRIGSTDKAGDPKYVVSPNLKHVALIGTKEAEYILGRGPKPVSPAEAPPTPEVVPLRDKVESNLIEAIPENLRNIPRSLSDIEKAEVARFEALEKKGVSPEDAWRDPVMRRLDSERVSRTYFEDKINRIVDKLENATWYRGSTEFELVPKEREGIYFTDMPGLASAYPIGRTTTNVGAYRLDIKNPLIKHRETSFFDKARRNELEAAGHDSVINMDDMGVVREVVVFDASKVKRVSMPEEARGILSKRKGVSILEPIEEAPPSATFLGYQENIPGKPPIALYNIEGGKRHGSTVTARTLKEEGIPVPETPSPEVAKPVPPAVEEPWGMKGIKIVNKKPPKNLQEGRDAIHGYDTKNKILYFDEKAAKERAKWKGYHPEDTSKTYYKKFDLSVEEQKLHEIAHIIDNRMGNLWSEILAKAASKDTSFNWKGMESEIYRALEKYETKALVDKEWGRGTRGAQEGIGHLIFDFLKNPTEATKEYPAFAKYYRQITSYPDYPAKETIIPAVEEPAVKISDRIQELHKKGKKVEEIAKAIDMTPEATAMAMYDMELFKPKKFITMDKIESEAADIVSKAQNLDQVYRGIQELATRYVDNLDVGFKDRMGEIRYEEWGNEILGKVNAAREKAGMIKEPDPNAPLAAVTKEGERLSYVDPTDKGGFESRKAAENYRMAFEELGEVIENPTRPGQFVFRSEPPVEGLSFGGTYEFQKMYDRFVNRTKERARKEGKTIRPEAEEILNRGRVIKQRTVKGLPKPPIYESVYGILKNSKVLKETMFRGLEHPIRTFREAGGEALLDLTTHEYDFRDNAGIRWARAARKKRRELFGDLSKKERERIVIHAVSRQKKGPDLLRVSKVKNIPKWEELTPREQRAYIDVRDRLKAWYIRANRMRKSIGKEPFPETEDYFTFARSFTLMERAGFRPFDMKKDILDAQFVKMSEVPTKHSKPRTKSLYKLDLDFFDILERYEGDMIKHITMSPLVAKVREYLGPIKDPTTNKKFLLRNVNPELAKSLDAWANYIGGMRPPHWKLHPAIENVLYRINSNLVASILGFMVRSALIQPSALNLTVAEIGFSYTMRGILSQLADVPGMARDTKGILFGRGPSLESFATKKSKVLLSRTEAIVETSGIKATRSGWKQREMGWTTRQSLKPLQILDFVAAKATWDGAFMYGKEVLKLSGKRLSTYADDVVTRTQASARPGHTPPIRRSALGRSLTLFQTFTLNEWDFMVKDVLGLRRIRAADEARSFNRAMKWIAAATLINILYEDVLGVHSPRPTPIRAFTDELDKGGDVPSALLKSGLEALDMVPFVGGTRYGRGVFGPVGELVGETQKFIARDSFAPPAAEMVGYWLGVPGTAQISKAAKARERGETPYGQIVGTYTPKVERRAASPRVRRPTRRVSRRRR